MSNHGIVTSETRPPEHPRRRSTRHVPLLAALGLAVLAAAGHLVVIRLGPADPPPERGRGLVVAAQPTPIGYWPSAANTGVPAGTILRNSGSLSLRTNGQVITGLNIIGCVSVHASNVRITRSRITCGSVAYALRTFSTTTNLVVEDVEIDGQGHTAAAVCCGNYTLRRVNIHNTIDGPRVGSNTVIVDSYIHGLARQPATHNDTLQVTGGVGMLIQHNTLQPYDPATGDPFNACLMIGSETAPAARDILMMDNYCDGGNWSIGVRTDLVGSNVLFRGNKFGRHYRYGIIARPRQAGVNWESDNVWLDTGQRVVR